MESVKLVKSIRVSIAKLPVGNNLFTFNWISDNQIGNVFHWETLLPVVPEPTVPKDVSMRKNVNTPRRQRSRASINRSKYSNQYFYHIKGKLLQL